MRFIVGDGSVINTWTDLWIPDYPPRQPRGLTREIYEGKVNLFFSEGTREWNETKLRKTFYWIN